MINVLEEAKKHKCTTIAIPNLSVKLSEYPLDKGCRSILETCLKWSAYHNKNSIVKKIILCAKNAKDFEVWKKEFDEFK